MANVVKITEVNLYAAMISEEGAVACIRTKKFLEANNIQYAHYVYSDEAQIPPLFEALGTWTFGPEFRQVSFSSSSFPFVTWKEFHDDYERFVEIAVGLNELAQSTLIKNKDRVVKNT